MNIETYQIWIIISILLFIAEIFVPTFLAFSLAIGCLASAALAFFSVGFEGQVIPFSVGTLVSFFGVRSYMLEHGH
jgi:membrane protein implicated in regulation of membrane protease activity